MKVFIVIAWLLSELQQNKIDILGYREKNNMSNKLITSRSYSNN